MVTRVLVFGDGNELGVMCHFTGEETLGRRKDRRSRGGRE